MVRAEGASSGHVGSPPVLTCLAGVLWPGHVQQVKELEPLPALIFHRDVLPSPSVTTDKG